MSKTPKAPSRAAERIATREVDYGLEDRLIPIAVAIEMAGIGRTMIYKLMRQGRFPRSCNPVGSSSARWSEREVKAWVVEQLASRAA